ncbi:hypothetical protein SAMD00019534_105630 [Acytostelium subglobosum LB1]|uniref:hypothetical protein n=1 Tax=Acytostelium subglobosum LB1 TaxID=1410327 RepID=UPI00064494F1|nr:hypothetical protein SAMD00019534_105630 [Acytostelium subglobosum LB1]GAM27388.1 hypothetical protein SAMD00019534_105630 [Acytostelium subglobosum LB1]|eukprot:XP_012749855.1 hypothetical protein SAMD00019534_105630 [Acytostelium subglobosum LB1]
MSKVGKGLVLTESEALFELLIYTPFIYVSVNKCLVNLNSFEFLRRDGAHIFLRLFIFLAHDMAADTLVHLFLGTSPPWLYNDHLVMLLTVWTIMTIFPYLLQFLLRQLKVINILLLITLSVNDITQIYSLPMYPSEPFTQRGYTWPILPPSTLGSLFITLISSQTGELLKTCIIHYFRPAYPTSLTAPSLPWITIGFSAILYHFLANPHAETINSVLVHQYVSQHNARLILYGLFLIVFMMDAFRPQPILDSGPAHNNVSNNYNVNNTVNNDNLGTSSSTLNKSDDSRSKVHQQ